MQLSAQSPWSRDIVLIVVAIAILFGIVLGKRPLGPPDEARYSEIPREMVVTGDYVTPRVNYVKYFEKPPLFYWMQAGAIRAFGESEWSMRFWNALMALLGCVGVYVAGRFLFDRRTGLLSAAVLATSFLYYAMSGVVTLDMTVSSLLSLALLTFLCGLRLAPGRSRRLTFWLFYVLAALAVLAKGLIGLVIPMMIIGMWILLLNEWRVLRAIYLPSGLLLFALIAVPWHVLVWRANPEFGHFYFIHEHFERFLTNVHQRYQPPWFFIPILVLGFFPWVTFFIPAMKFNFTFAWRARREHRDVIFLGLWAGLIFAFFSASHSKLIPYILPVMPPVAILLARYLAAVSIGTTPAPRTRHYLLLAVIAAALLIASIVAPHVRQNFDVDRISLYLFNASLSVTVVLALFYRRRAQFNAVVASLLIGTAIAWPLFANAVAPADARSVKALSLALKPRLQPGDTVASYRYYYHDLPFYLQRRIVVADWQGELRFGMEVEDTSAWMIDRAAFWKRWQGAGRIYAVTNRSDLTDFVRSGYPYYVVAENPRTVILSNKKQ